jgi:hypothetical protein
MVSKWYGRLAGLAVLAGVVLTGVPAAVQAAQYPAIIHALPNPPGAPENDTFLVTVPHHRVVPDHAVFHFISSTGQRSTSTEPLKKLNQYQWETVYHANSQGRLSVDIYAAHQKLIAAASYPVGKSKNSPVGRIVIGALFIGVSLWFWWRQQRLFGRR